MPGVAPPPSDHHGNSFPSTTGSDVMSEEEAQGAEAFLASLLPNGESIGEEALDNLSQDGHLDNYLSQDGRFALQGFAQLERKWILWHEFMKEHTHLDAWLRLAERAASSPNSTQVTYVTAKEELRKFERLQCEAGSRLVQLDSLTHQNRTLTRLFHGAMRARLLALARDCGRRWDCVNTRLETVTHTLKGLVSEREGFEAEREELALWLADLDIRLSEVEQLTGNSCDKMRHLQSFQESVCVNSGRVNSLLERGEALIQRSEPSDALDVESELLDLLLHCSHVFNSIGRLHTRLLSMRLVFEDDSILSPVCDSGCPSEALLEDEGALDKPLLDLPVSTNPTLDHDLNKPTNLKMDANLDHPSSTPPPPSPSSPPHLDHLVLEWDPSVDIGGSVSHDDADSSYFSAKTGLRYRDQSLSRDGLKRRSYLSSLGSQSDITNDITNQEAHPVFCPVRTWECGTQLSKDQWVTSTPDGQVCGPVSFDRGRVRAWLGDQSPSLQERRASCYKAVQTEWGGQWDVLPSQTPPRLHDNQHRHDDSQGVYPAPSPSHALNRRSDWMRGGRQSNFQSSGAEARDSRLHTEQCCTAEPESYSDSSVTSRRGTRCSLLSPAFLYPLLAAVLALVACLAWSLQEPDCHYSNSLWRTSHLALRYVNGPPPT